jgi:hypothetical protein
VADELGDEEGVAARGGAEVGRQPRRVTLRLEQGADVGGAETVDPDPGEQLVAPEVDGQALELRGRAVRWDAGRAEDEHAAGVLVPEHVLDQLQRGRVGPVEVVEHDEQREVRRFGPEHLGDRFEQEVPLDRGLRDVPPGFGHELLELGEQHGEVAAVGGDAPAGLGRHRAQGGADGLDHRLERDDGFGGRPAPQHNGAGLVDLSGEPAGEAGLAGARFADEERQVALP